MKQRFDIPRALSNLDLSGLSNSARQKLGFDCQVPVSYEEYFGVNVHKKFTQETV